MLFVCYSLENLIPATSTATSTTTNGDGDGDTRSAWVFTFNHAISDQQSLNTLITDLMQYLTTPTTPTSPLQSSTIQRYPFPPSIEQIVAPEPVNFRTIKWALYQSINGLRSPVVLPDHIKRLAASELEVYKTQYVDPSVRHTYCKQFIINKNIMSKLLVLCKTYNITITYCLSTLILILTSATTQDAFYSATTSPTTSTASSTNLHTRNLRFLLSVSLRPYQSPTSTSTWPTPLQVPEAGSGRLRSDWLRDSIGCAAGAVDYVTPVPAILLKRINEMIHTSQITPPPLSSEVKEAFWTHARECQQISNTLIYTNNYVPESVRLFGFGMSLPPIDILKAVEIEEENPVTLGRGFSCGVSNAGILSPTLQQGGVTGTDSKEDRVCVSEVYYGTSHSRSGVLALLSCMTVEGCLYGNLQFAVPLISEGEGELYARVLVKYIESLVN